MAQIHIYNSVSNEHRTINANGKLKDILPNHDFSHSVCLNAGNRIDENFFADENDVLYIREVPQGVTTAIVIAAAALVVGVGVGVGAKLYADKKAKEAQQKMEDAQQAAKKLAQSTQSLPFLKGAKNAVALGRTVQYAMGRMYNTPYLLTDGYYSISGDRGEKQYWTAILSLGQNNQCLEDIKIGTSRILTLGGNVPQEGVFNFDSDSVFYDSENKIEIRQGTDFETDYFKQKIVSTQDGSEIKHDYGKDLEPIIKQLPSNTKKVEVCIQFNALRRFDDENWVSRSVTINPYWSNDGGETWNLFSFNQHLHGVIPDTVRATFICWTGTVQKVMTWMEYQNYGNTGLIYDDDGTRKPYFHKLYTIITSHYGDNSNTFTYNSRTAIRFVAEKEFTYEEAYGKDLLIKLERTNAKLDSNSNEDCYLLYYNSFCYDAQKSNEEDGLVDCLTVESDYTHKTCRMAIRMIANNSTQDVLDEINTVSYGTARTWDSELKEWKAERTRTRNPAAWILEILTSDFHGHSQYDDSEIDLDSFGRLYEYCEENEFYTDGILTKGEKKRDIITKILQTVFATLYEDSDGKLSIAIDEKETTPVALLNSECVRSITVGKSFERTPDGIKATFTNCEGWAVDTAYFMLDGRERTEESVLTEEALELVTTYEHVYKIVQRKIRSQILQPRTVKADVGKEGDYYPLYSTVMLQLKEMQQGICSSLITGIVEDDGFITAIKIADLVHFENDKTYGIIIQAQNESGMKHYYLGVSGQGATRTLTLLEPIEITEDIILPEAGNILSFGYLNEGAFDSVTNVMKIVGIEPNGDNGITLDLADYNPAIYEFGEIPEYKTNLTDRPNESKTGLTDVKFGEYAQNIQNSVDDIATGESYGPPAAPLETTGIAEENKITLSCITLDSGLQNSIKQIFYQIRKGENAEWEIVDTNEYYFRRSVDGYPERNDLSGWAVRSCVMSIYGKLSDWSEEGAVDTSNYGTWNVVTPTVDVKISGRVVTLICSEVYSGTRKIYGNIKYGITIQRADKDGENFYTPNTTDNPYLNEDYYRAKAVDNVYPTSAVLSDGVFIQTVPLAGQDNESIQQYTTYRYKVFAQNEKGNSESVTVTANAECDSIRDIVKANETAKQAYITELSAITAHLGEITDGSLAGNDLNYWTLTNKINAIIEASENKDFQGAFRVGGDSEYIKVVPTVETIGGIDTVVGHRVYIKAGVFEISSSASNINGELLIQESDDSLFRAKLTQKGLFFQTRENSLSNNWTSITQQDISGTKTPAVYTDNSMVITNSAISERRKNGSDIGLVLWNGAEIYHFDTDMKNQNGEQLISITSDGGVLPILNGLEDYSSGLGVGDFEPAILAVAPYSTIGKSLYGNFCINKKISGNTWGIEFWFRYGWDENQELFSIGNEQQKLWCVLSNAEPFYNEILTDNVPYFEEIEESEALPYNEIINDVKYLHYRDSRNHNHVWLLKDYGVKFLLDDWCHFSAVCNGETILVSFGSKYMADDVYFTLEMRDAFVDDINVIINETQGLCLVDELMISEQATPDLSVIMQNTKDRIPYGSLDYQKKHFILDVDDSEVWTNFFDSTFVKAKLKTMLLEFLDDEDVQTKIKEILNDSEETTV